MPQFLWFLIAALVSGGVALYFGTEAEILQQRYVSTTNTAARFATPAPNEVIWREKAGVICLVVACILALLFVIGVISHILEQLRQLNLLYF